MLGVKDFLKSEFEVTWMGTQRSISDFSPQTLLARYVLTTLESRVNDVRASVRVEMSH